MEFVRRPRAAGFTLLEILVALVVIGIAVAAIQINLFADDQRRLRTEGERLAALLTALADESVTSAQPLAVSFTHTGYAFWERDATGEWRPRPGDELFAGREMPADIRVVELRARERPLSLDPAAAQRLVFSPSGLHPPFSILLALDDLRLRVVADAAGELRVEDA